jgi:fluoride ion exporter CrcB/FEX
MATRLALIAAFGALGSVLRYLVSLAATPLSVSLARALRSAPETTLPLGTLICNISGSLAIGALGYWLNARNAPEHVRAALIVGLLGG